MTVARAFGVAVVGVVGHIVEVEADLASGLPALTLVGLPDTALLESRDRLRAAVVNSGVAWPSRRITLNLSPASLPKAGSGFDLPLAGALLAAAEMVPAAGLARRVLVGELGLDGQVRPVRGVLCAALAAARSGRNRLVVAAVNAAEAGLVPAVTVECVHSLRGLLALLRGEPPGADGAWGEPLPTGAPRRVTSPGCLAGVSGVSGVSEANLDAADAAPPDPTAAAVAVPDLRDVAGQPLARRAVEVAAAGGHHLAVIGPPGAGKTMLAARLPGLLPDLDRRSALEVTAVHSVAGILPPGSPLIVRPPFADPHHTASVAAIVGGGSGLPRPGAASIAHRGVLLLDEAPEFGRGVLEALRQPLESGTITVHRAAGAVRFPARFLLVIAANPCPCGAGGPRLCCTCPSTVRRRYLARLSGPLLDRVDLQISVEPVSVGALTDDTGLAEDSATVLTRVVAARARTARRLAGTPWRTNADVPGAELRRRFPISGPVLAPVRRLLQIGALTARGHDRVLRIAWTLADLAGEARPGPAQVAEALVLRGGSSGAAA
ncbi:MAG TPA: ATP-binding protein [Mycobacteriales bacterium]|nr:ATP-binding protein [Mycobacteriales bacterium]